MATKTALEAMTVDIATAKRAAAVCFQNKRPFIVWGKYGCGKSQMIAQLADSMSAVLYDCRTSDKEPPDLAGLPVADQVNRCVQWLINHDTIPWKRFDENGKHIKPKYKRAILFLDEFDRSMVEVMNVCLQILLDRKVNGHELEDNVLICAAGNGESDSGTTPITGAAATRMTHIYIDPTLDSSIKGFQEYANNKGMAPWLSSYVGFRKEEIQGDAFTFIERAEPTFRTLEWAHDLIESCYKIGTDWAVSPSVMNCLVYGTVGQVVGRSMMAYRKMCTECPQPEDIYESPLQTKLPKDAGVYYATGVALVQDIKPKGKSEDMDKTKAACRYVGRWPEEQQATFFRRASDSKLKVAATPEYKAWEKEYRSLQSK